MNIARNGVAYQAPLAHTIRLRRLTSEEDMPVIIQADRTVPTELLVRVIDEAKLGGAMSVSISTDDMK